MQEPQSANALMTTSHSSASSSRKSAPVRVIFLSGDELNTVVSLLQKLAHMSEKFVGIGFVIVQETNALVT